MLGVLEFLSNGNFGGHGTALGQGICGFFSVLLQCFCDLFALRTVANFLGKTTKCKVSELWKAVLLMVALGCHGM